MTRKIVSLDKYKKEFYRKLKRSYTQIKCEKCDGRYYYADRIAFATYPLQRVVLCDKCEDKQIIPVD